MDLLDYSEFKENIAMNSAYKALSSLNRPFTVLVEGNIASGKTTFLSYLNKKYDNVCILAEPIQLWRNCNGHNLLQLLYEDPKKWCFTFQSYVQLTMLQHHTLKTQHPLKLMERSLYSARYCFVDKLRDDGILPKASASVIHEWFKWITQNTNVGVDLIVYLRTTPEEAYDRLLKRNRKEEKTVTLKYLKELHEVHENWLYHKTAHSCPAPVLVLNANLGKGEIEDEYRKVEDVLPPVFLQSLKARQWQTLNVPTITKTKDSSNTIDYLEDEVQDNVYKAVLQEAYYRYRLLNGTAEKTIESASAGVLKTKLEQFFKQYIKNLKLAHCDILNVFSGIQYLPLDTHTFLNVQCFINGLECSYPDIKHSAFLYNDHLIWSGINPNDMQIIYRHLITTLFPVNMETELRGGSMPRHSSSPFASLHHGRFITGPTNLKSAKSVGDIPKVYLFHEETPVVYYLVVYRALSASVCLFVKATAKLTLEFFKELDELISPKLTAIVTDIAEYCQKQVVTPSNIPENSPRFIYFNKLNLAYKSTVHLDNKQTGNIACAKELVKVMADLNAKKSLLGHAGETVVKTMHDYWVVAKNSNERECYIALQQKNANLIDISEEIKKVCDTELKGIFFHPM